jgi:hypothetical protein
VISLIESLLAHWLVGFLIISFIAGGITIVLTLAFVETFYVDFTLKRRAKKLS